MDRLNNLQRREWYEEYFSAVDVPQIERDKRVQLAEDIDDAYDGLFDLIAVMTVMNQEMDREYLTGYLQTRIADVGNGSDYLNEYALVTARDVVNTTLDHEGEEWYTSEDRKLLLSAGDAQTIGNYEQFEKALAQGKTHKTWRSELLKTTRKDHSEMHGKTIPIKEMFVFPDCEMLFPRDVVNGTAKQVVNCRCSLMFDIKPTEATKEINKQDDNSKYAPNIDFFVGSNGKVLESKYKEWIGQSKRNEYLAIGENKKYINAIDNIYRPGAFIGDGSSAAIYRFEKATGLKCGRKDNHLQKCNGMIKYIQNKVLQENLTKEESATIQKVLSDLQSAVAEDVL